MSDVNVLSQFTVGKKKRVKDIATAAFGDTSGIDILKPMSVVGVTTLNLPEIGDVEVNVAKRGNNAGEHLYKYNNKQMKYDELITTIYGEHGYSPEDAMRLLQDAT